MKKEKKRPPVADAPPVVELDQTEAANGFSLQEMADALGAQMEQARDGQSEETPAPAPGKGPAAPADEETRKKLRELEDTVKQLVAENRNQKARLEGDFRTKMKYANEGFFREFLLVKDDLEKALSFAPVADDEKTAAFVDGVRHLNSAVDAILKRYCVEPFESLGTPFDPNLHQAMRMADVAGKGPNEITAQYLKGWRYQDRVLRPAMVEVASGNAPAEEQKEITTETNDTEGSNG